MTHLKQPVRIRHFISHSFALGLHLTSTFLPSRCKYLPHDDSGSPLMVILYLIPNIWTNVQTASIFFFMYILFLATVLSTGAHWICNCKETGAKMEL